MSLGSFASRSVATRVVATDGSGDFTDIQSAIDDLPSTGGVVYVKEGTYTISSIITFGKNDVALIGAGNATKIDDTASPDIDFLIQVTSRARCRVEGIRFIGSASKPVGIELKTSTECSVVGCFFETDVDGPTLTNADRCIITRNTMTSSDGDSIIIDGSSTDNVISNNIVNTSSTRGINLVGDKNSVVGNVVIGSSHIGIDVRGDNNSVIGNVIDSSGDNNIQVTGDSNCISGNQVNNGSARGIHLLSGADKNVIVGNQVVGNSTAQIVDSGSGNQLGHNQTT